MFSGEARYEYAAACVPNHGFEDNNLCDLILYAGAVETMVSLTSQEITLTFLLRENTAFKQSFDDSYFPEEDIEQKAILIISDHPLQVLIHKNSVMTGDDDVYLVPERNRAKNEYFTATYGGDNGCASNHYKDFYLIISYVEGTEVNITQQDGISYNLVMPEYGTFVQRTTEAGNNLAQGTRILSSGPITVVSGSLCHHNSITGGGPSGTYVGSISAVDFLGYRYVVPQITFADGSSSGYSVSVVSTDSDTEVICDGESYSSSQAGETLTMEFPDENRPVLVECSKPCLVIQYTKYRGHLHGNFMQQILASDDFSTGNHAFTNYLTYSFPPHHHMVLVVEGWTDGSDIYLNGNPLAGHLVRVFHEYVLIQLSLEAGYHTINSGKPYAAYIYTRGRDFAAGAGYGLLPN